MTLRIPESFNEPVIYTEGFFKSTTRDSYKDQRTALSTHFEHARFKATLVTYSKQIKAALKEGKIEKAWEIYSSIPKEHPCNSTILNPILNYYVKIDDTNGVDAVLREISRKHIVVGMVHYNTIINSYMNACKFDKVTSILREMQEAGLRLDKITYNTLINGYMRFNKIAEAELTFQQMKEAGCQPNKITYNTLICNYLRLNKIAEAELTFQQMKEAGCQPDKITYNTLIWGYLRLNKLAEATSILGQMQRAGFHPNIEVYSILINGYLETHRLDEAKSIFQQMKKAGFQPAAAICTALLEYSYSMNDFENSRIFFQESPFFIQYFLPILDDDTRCLDLRGKSHAEACIAILLLLEYPFQKTMIVFSKWLHSALNPVTMKDTIVQFIENKNLPFAIEPSINEFGVIDEESSELVLDLSVFTYPSFDS